MNPSTQSPVEPRPVSFFAPIVKLDDDQRLVWGYASTPTRDLQDERVSLKAVQGALPDYMEWGNIREMHQLSAVGKTQQADIDDKGLYIRGKVVDDSAWKKVKEGVYQGFSIGGDALSKVGDEITRLRITEISLVDRPANPECKIDAFKAAQPVAKGLVDKGEGFELVKFDPDNPEFPDIDADLVLSREEVGILGSLLTKLAVRPLTLKAKPAVADGFSGPAPGKPKTHDHPGQREKPSGDTEEQILYTAGGADAGGDCPSCKGTGQSGQGETCAACGGTGVATAAKAAGRWIKSVTKVAPGHVASCSYCSVIWKISQREDVSESDKQRALSEYGDVKYADEKNKKYPIDTEAHIRAAWNYINKEKNAAKYEASEVSAIKSKIVAAWKDKIDKDGPPSAQASNGKGKDKALMADGLAKAIESVGLKKYMSGGYYPSSNLGRLACLYDELKEVSVSLRYEAADEYADPVDNEMASKVQVLLSGIGNLIAQAAVHEVGEEEEEEAEKVILALEAHGITQETVKMADSIFEKRFSKEHREAVTRAAHHTGEAKKFIGKAANNHAAAKMLLEGDDRAQLKAAYAAKNGDGDMDADAKKKKLKEHMDKAASQLSHAADHIEMVQSHLGKAAASWMGGANGTITGPGIDSPTMEDGRPYPDDGSVYPGKGAMGDFFKALSTGDWGKAQEILSGIAKMACPKCKAANAADAETCAKCGASMGKAAECQSCHKADNPEDAKFCAGCGTAVPVKKAAAPAATEVSEALMKAREESAYLKGKLETIEKMGPGGNRPAAPKAHLFSISKGSGAFGVGDDDNPLKAMFDGVDVDATDPNSIVAGASKVLSNMLSNPKKFGKSLMDPSFKGGAGKGVSSNGAGTAS